MEVILLEQVDNLGKFGDVVKVRDGYARNYLLPQNKCLRATNENKAYFDSQKADMLKTIEAEKKEAEGKSKAIDGIFLVVIRQAGEDGRLYGSVSIKDIAESFAQKKLGVDKHAVRLDQPIKNIGVYPVRIKLHPEVAVEVRINVARSEEDAKEAEELFLSPPKAEAKQEEFTSEEQAEKKTAKGKKSKKSKEAETEAEIEETPAE